MERDRALISFDLHMSLCRSFSIFNDWLTIDTLKVGFHWRITTSKINLRLLLGNIPKKVASQEKPDVGSVSVVHNHSLVHCKSPCSKLRLGEKYTRVNNSLDNSVAMS